MSKYLINFEKVRNRDHQNFITTLNNDRSRTNTSQLASDCPTAIVATLLGRVILDLHEPIPVVGKIGKSYRQGYLTSCAFRCSTTSGRSSSDLTITVLSPYCLGLSVSMPTPRSVVLRWRMSSISSSRMARSSS